ncbi:MAG: RIP metalloprotease RseP [Alphaproteobacteria bacterium]
MDFVWLVNFGDVLVSYVLPFLFVLTIVVFFHELGHFLVARWCGVKVDSFSVGFGRELFGYTDRHGTRWKLGWVPLGGYVKFHGDEGAASTPDRSQSGEAEPDSGNFHSKSVAKRAAIVAAGPIANFILAIVIFAVIFSTVGRPQVAPVVGQVQPDSAAQVAGFAAGDLIIEIEGQPIESFAELQRAVRSSANEEIAITVRREAEELVLIAIPRLQEIEGSFGGKMRVGVLGISRKIGAGGVTVKRYNPVIAVWMGAQETYSVVAATLSYLGGVIAGRESADQLGGPIRIAQISGQVATLGLLALINLAAILSVSIGMINLFPIPMLDGGHLVYYAIEAVRGRPLSPAIQDAGFRIGMALVLMLMLFATWNDLVQMNVF